MDLKAFCSGLRRGEDGIWYSAQAETIFFPSSGYQKCFAIEEDSFWFQHRNECIVAAVSQRPPPGEGTIFDVGGGNGFVSMALKDAGFPVALVEPGRTGAVNAKSRGINTVICATLAGAEFQVSSLPACGLFDVLEHVKDDVTFLRFIESLLIPGGRLYVTVPAYLFLWSHQDELAGHFRRYTLKTLSAALRRAGLKVSFATYFFRPLPVAILLLRTIPYRLGIARDRIEDADVRRDHAVHGLLSGFLKALLASEVARIRGSSTMGFGGSCLAVATKRA